MGLQSLLAPMCWHHCFDVSTTYFNQSQVQSADRKYSNTQRTWGNKKIFELHKDLHYASCRNPGWILWYLLDHLSPSRVASYLVDSLWIKVLNFFVPWTHLAFRWIPWTPSQNNVLQCIAERIDKILKYKSSIWHWGCQAFLVCPSHLPCLPNLSYSYLLQRR